MPTVCVCVCMFQRHQRRPHLPGARPAPHEQARGPDQADRGGSRHSRRHPRSSAVPAPQLRVPRVFYAGSCLGRPLPSMQQAPEQQQRSAGEACDDGGAEYEYAEQGWGSPPADGTTKRCCKRCMTAARPQRPARVLPARRSPTPYSSPFRGPLLPCLSSTTRFP